ncbi:PilZ domain-containing protein [Cellvibrio sp.]|uniref:PilZ domain-containing protein n=1 Tax=Cellvibrio sp. TaxID=1965322 RepID=UPI0039648308
MGEERRLFERKALKGPARITRTGASALIGRMADISAGGACVVLDLNLPVKSVVQLEFNILVRRTSALAGFTAAAVVTHVSFSSSDNGFRVGVQFTALTDIQKQLIQQYLENRLPRTKANSGEIADKEPAESPATESALPEEIPATTENS